MTITSVFCCKKEDGQVTIKLPDMIKGKNITQIENRIDSFLTKDITQVSIDFLDIQNIYSVLITVIMRIRKKITQSGGSLYLVNVSERCREQFESMNLDKVLIIHE